MTMRLVVSGFAVVVLLLVSGCAKFTPKSPARQEQGSSEPKLKVLSKNDRVVITEFYETQSFSPPVPPPRNVGRTFGIITSWIPGHISFQPVTITEPAKEQAGKLKATKGLRVEILSMNYNVAGKKGQPREAFAFMEDNEARDFDTALSYLTTVVADWEKQKPGRRREVSFEARDFMAKLLMAEDGPVVLAASGGPTDGAFVRIPANQIGELQSKLKAALKTLETFQADIQQ